MTRIGTKRKPEYKQLNFDTAMRNPERLKDVLFLIKEYEGMELNDKNLLDIVCSMYENDIVKSNKFNIKKLHSKEQIQKKVIDIMISIKEKIKRCTTLKNGSLQDKEV